MTQARDPIDVVAGILRDPAGRVLLAQRPCGTHLSGTWEFPGGKIEESESAASALRRELEEELGVTIGDIEPLIAVPWSYEEKTIRLHAFCVGAFDGVPTGRQGQALKWIDVDATGTLAMPPADRPIITALRLPRSYAITPDLSDDALLSCVEALCAGGQRLVQLRAKSISTGSVATIIAAARIARAHGATLLVNAAPERVRDLAVDGVHLPAAELMRLNARPLEPGRWVAASCHDERELAHAAAIGVDFAVLGPVLPTRSHPAAVPLGWERFAALCALAPFPVYALGGMTRGDVATAIAAGAQGIAGISAFTAH